MTSRKKKRLYFILGGAVLLLLLIAVIKNSGDSESGSKGSFKVAVAETSVETITETVDANGQIQPEVVVHISSDVSGQIIELLVKEGDKVEAGDLLCKINPDLFESGLRRAEAGLNSARANLANSKARLAQVKAQFIATEQNYKRNKKLFDQDAISQSEWETAQSTFEMGKADVNAAEETVNASNYTVKSSEATVMEAQDNLKRTSIYSPISGTVSALFQEQGESVVGTAQMQGTTIMDVANLTRMEADVEVNENDIVRLELGDTANIEVDAYLGRKFKGIVTEIANSATSSGRNVDQVTNFSVKIRLLEKSYQDLIKADRPHLSPFRPGMSTTVEILTETANDVLAVPIEAVTTREDTSSNARRFKFKAADEETSNGDGKTDEPLTCVFVSREGKAILTLVETGVQDSRVIEIKSGLQAGDKVVISPYDIVSQKLRNRDKIKETKKSELFKK